MEPIDYKDALRRRWLLILVLGVVGAVVGVLVPVKAPYPPPRSLYGAVVEVGFAPGSAAGLKLPQLVYDTNNIAIMEAAAKSAHVTTKVQELQNELIIVSKKKKKKSATPAPPSIGLSVKQPTAKGSAKLTNAYAIALDDYITAKLEEGYTGSVQGTQAQINRLSAQLQNINDQIAALTPTTTTTTTTTTSTTTTTRPPKPTTTTTAPPATTTTVAGGPASTSTSTTAGGRSRTAATTAAATALRGAGAATPAPIWLTDSKGSAANSQLQTLQAEQNVVRQELQAAVSKQQKLANQGKAPASGFTVYKKATALAAKPYPAKTSLFAHRSVRAGVGFLGGVVIGILVALLLYALDKRLRTVGRVEQTSTYPVVAEIPAEPRPRPSSAPRPASRPARPARTSEPRGRKAAKAAAKAAATAGAGGTADADDERVAPTASDGDEPGDATPPSGTPPVLPDGVPSTRELPVTASNGGAEGVDGPPLPVIHLIDQPASPIAEAYRRLRMALLMEPLARTRPAGPGLAAPGLPPGVEPLGQYGQPTATNALGGVGAPPMPSTEEEPAEIEPRRSILVVSPGHEPSRPMVVANLAAAYAEAGSRVVVLTTGDLRQQISFNGANRPLIVPGWRPDIGSLARPSRIRGVWTVALGEVLSGPGQLDAAAGPLIEAALGFADIVIVEAPPILVVTDAEAFVRAVDVILLVEECWHTTVSQSSQAGSLLRRLRAPVLGAVLTNAKLKTKDLRLAGSEAVPGRGGARRRRAGTPVRAGS